MRNKFMSIFTLVIVLLIAVSCIPFTEEKSSQFDLVQYISMGVSGYRNNEGAYYVFAGDDGSGEKLIDSCTVYGYIESDYAIYVTEESAVYAQKADGTVLKVTDSTLIKAGEEYTLYSRFRNFESNKVKVIGATTNQIYSLSSNNGGVFLKGATIDDLWRMTIRYCTGSGYSVSYSDSAYLSTKDSAGNFVYQVKQLDANKNELSNGDLTQSGNTLLENCKYLSVSRKGTIPVLLEVTDIIDIADTSKWEVVLSGGYSNQKVSDNVYCKGITMYISKKGDNSVHLKNLSSPSKLDGPILTIERDSSYNITSSKLNAGWEIKITRSEASGTSTEVGSFTSSGTEVKVNLSEAGTYTITVKCTNPQSCGLPSGTVIEGSHTFTVSAANT